MEDAYFSGGWFCKCGIASYACVLRLAQRHIRVRYIRRNRCLKLRAVSSKIGIGVRLGRGRMSVVHNMAYAGRGRTVLPGEHSTV